MPPLRASCMSDVAPEPNVAATCEQLAAGSAGKKAIKNRSAFLQGGLFFEVLAHKAPVSNVRFLFWLWSVYRAYA